MIVDLRGDDDLVGLVRSMKAFSFCFTRSGEPTAEQARARDTWAFSRSDQEPSIVSTGGSRRPGLPRRNLTNAFWSDVKSRSASRSVSAANTPKPSMT